MLKEVLRGEGQMARAGQPRSCLRCCDLLELLSLHSLLHLGFPYIGPWMRSHKENADARVPLLLLHSRLTPSLEEGEHLELEDLQHPLVANWSNSPFHTH